MLKSNSFASIHQKWRFLTPLECFLPIITNCQKWGKDSLPKHDFLRDFENNLSVTLDINWF